jgi:hypothetical protein
MIIISISARLRARGGAVQYAKVPVSDLTGVCETLLITRAQARTRFPDLGFAGLAAERVNLGASSE